MNELGFSSRALALDNYKVSRFLILLCAYKIELYNWIR